MLECVLSAGPICSSVAPENTSGIAIAAMIIVITQKKSGDNMPWHVFENESRNPFMIRNTCCFCGNPLCENDIMKDAFRCNTTWSFAKNNFKILRDMVASDNPPDVKWIAGEIDRVMSKVMLLNCGHLERGDNA